jgi:hypothetical protein
MAISAQEKTAIIDWLKGNLQEQSKKQQAQNERAARQAIARVLLEEEPLPRWLRWLLAERFIDLAAQLFVLKSTRARGRPTKALDWEIATIVERRIKAGDLMKQACGYAADRFGVSARTAEKAHAEWKDQIRALGPQVRIITSRD